jgi:hypothetical protein
MTPGPAAVLFAATLLGFGCTRGSARLHEDDARPARVAEATGCVAGSLLTRRRPRPVPEIRDGKATGWRLYNVDPALAGAGVLDGDLLVDIDGQPAAQSLNRCLDGVTLKLRRNGRELSVRYPAPDMTPVSRVTGR